jgi:hypothetical protein
MKSMIDFQFPPEPKPLTSMEVRLLSVCLALAGALALGLIVYGKFSSDEFEHLHAAWCVNAGMVPHVDFFEHHHPTLYWLLAPVIALFGEHFHTLIAARLLLFVFTLGAMVLLFRLGKDLFGARVALYSLPIWISAEFFFLRGLEIRPDVLQVFWSLAALERLVAHAKRKKTRDALLGGLFLFAAFATLQKAAFWILPLGLLVMAQVIRGDWTLRAGAAFAASFSVPLVVGASVLVALGHWDAYWLNNWTYNLQQAGRVEAFAIHGELRSSLFVDAIFWAAALSGLFLTWRSAQAPPMSKGVAFVALCAVVFPIVRTLGTSQYFLPALPLLALFAAATLLSFSRGSALLVALCLLVPAFHFVVDRPSQNRSQRKLIEYVLEHTPKDECVVDGDKAFNLFRPHCDYLWFLWDHPVSVGLYPRLRGAAFDNAAMIKKARPMFLGGWRMAENDPWLLENYETGQNESAQANHFRTRISPMGVTRRCAATPGPRVSISARAPT